MNESLFEEKLAWLSAALDGRDEALRTLEAFLRTASDDAIVRMNPLRFAAQRGLAPAEVVELFLHARKAGLLTMEWQYVCPGCGEIIERLTSLTDATAHAFCQVCSATRDADLSESVEVTFSVAPEVRRSRYHDPWSLEPEDHFFRYRFTQNGVVDDGSPLSDFLKRCAVACAYVEPGETRSFQLRAEPRYLWFTNGPALVVGSDRTDACRPFAFTYTGARSQRYTADIAAGPVRIEFTNATAGRYALMIVSLPEEPRVTMAPFLSGAQLLSSQTFRELFAEETIASGKGLAVKRLTVLFTDLRGSTAMYERIGDMKAFEIVRLHFGVLREVIARHSGALVKTIGDAVMASFVEPSDALRAALEMRARIARMHADAVGGPIGLKIGMHAGACLAVTLNDRLDYFGQTVNIAARVQALTGPGEIVVTDDVLRAAGTTELVAGLPIESSEARVKGVAGAIGVHRIQGGLPAV